MMPSPLTELFEAYGDDVEGALAAFGNVDPVGWDNWVDAAVERQYRVEYRRWLARHTRTAVAEALAPSTGQARLFEVGQGTKTLTMREVLVLAGVEYEIAGLSGARGAEVLSEVANRDEKPAKTTIVRANVVRKLAAHVLAESQRLGRDVSVAEVLGWEQAA